MKIHEAPHGINLVIETADTIYIGRFDSTDGFRVVLHDCCVHKLAPDEEPEAFVRQSATYGIAVDERDLIISAAGIQRVRKLGDVPKL